MGKKSKVLTVLPEAVREELNQKLISSSFTGYEALEDWLRNQGYEISESSIYRYSVKFQEELRNLEVAAAEAKAIVGSVPDDEDAVAQALTKLAQGKAFKILSSINPENIALDFQDYDKSAKKFADLVGSISKLNATSINLKKYAETVREKAKLTAESVGHQLKNKGISDTAIEAIKRDILGVAS